MNALELINSFEKCKNVSEILRLVKEEAIPMLSQMGLAESIIAQQKLEIKNLKNYIEGQNKKILALSFELEYTKQGDAFQ